jgi:UMF1 family MFS transporter
MNRRQVGAWVLFDFANSVYPAVITTVVFNYFFIQQVVGNESGEGDFWWGWAVSLSALIVEISSPLLGAIADRAGLRKRLLFLYVGLCVTAVSLFTTIGPGRVAYAFVLFVVANIGFEGAAVFYNAYLPDIVPKEKQGWVSGLGFGVGYAGSFIGLALAIPLARQSLDLVWIMVAVFFVVFSIPSLLLLPRDRDGEMSVGRAAAWGLSSFREIVAEVWAVKDVRRFLIAYFLYIDGVLTAIVMANSLAATTFGFTDTQLPLLFMVLQVFALVGALAFAKPADVWGPKKVLTVVLTLWTVTALSIYFVTTQEAFVVIAMVAGLGLGSAQATSRAFMASMIPDGREAEFFGFYTFCGRSSSVLGPLIFGYVALATGGDQRLAVMAISVLFLAGLILLQRVRDPKAVPSSGP